MRLFLWNAVLTLLVTSSSGALIPEPEVKIEVLQKPFICHRKTKGGDLMLVHYEGYLEKDGSLFHSTHKHNNGQPIWFTLGILEALKGWDQGLKGMCVGEKRKLIIPPALGYGKEGKGKIPPESTLILTSISWRFEMDQDPMNHSKKWILMMTGNSLKMRLKCI